jgi:hypothetical protein
MFRKTRSESISRKPYFGKTVLLVALAACLALPAAATAAGRPLRTPIPIGPESAPAGAVCPFAVSLVPVVNNAYNLTYPPDANGDIRQISTGNVVVQIMNDETGKTISLNVSGPVITVTHPDGSATITLQGPTFLADLIPPVPGFFLVDGRTVLNQSPSGDQTLVSFNGRVKLDICAALS